jgi:hypothetical protein
VLAGFSKTHLELDSNFWLPAEPAPVASHEPATAYYDTQELWPAASLERRRTILGRAGWGKDRTPADLDVIVEAVEHQRLVADKYPSWILFRFFRDARQHPSDVRHRRPARRARAR